MVIFFNRWLLKLLIFLIIASTPIFETVASADSEKINIKITFRSQFHEESNIDKLKLNHPIKISHAEITNHLVSMKYKSTFLGSKEEQVFSLLEIQKLAPILVKAFARVATDRTIRFNLQSKGGLTSGDFFSFKKYINWRFDSIRGEAFFKRNNVRDANIFSWHLMPNNDQRYFKTRDDKRIQKNWVVSSLKLPISHASEGGGSLASDKGSSAIKVNPKLEAKLEHLKYLYGKNLIDDEEYKAQQKKLFDELF